MIPIRVALLLLLLLIQINILAQPSDSTLDPVVITAALTAQKSSQTGRSVLTISGSEIARLPVHSIDELLRYVPGLEIQQRGPIGAQSDIVIRGGTFQQVLVLLDGVRLNDANTGHFSSYIPIALSEIERIEILKGASSAVFGSEAVGGVVQIITKTFALKKSRRQHLLAKLSAGEYGLINADVGGFYSGNKTSVSAGFLSNNTSGQQQRGIRGYVHSHTASVAGSHKINDKWQASFRTAFDDRSFAAQNFYTSIIADTASENVRSLWNGAALLYQAGRHTINITAGYKWLRDSFLLNKATVANNNKSDLLQGLVTDELKLTTGTALITGIQFINKKIASNDRGDHSISQGALFALLNSTVGKNLFISPALRIEWNERSGTELVPQLNLSYKMPALQLRASGGKTFRDADFTERFNNFNKAYVASGNRLGNPDLVAEHSFSYEAGADYFGIHSLRISGSVFQRRQSDLIDYISTPYANIQYKQNLSPTGVYMYAQNIGRVITSGVEADLSYVNNFSATRRLSATAGLTWLYSKSSNAAPSFYIASHAGFLSNFNIRYSAPAFAAGFTGLYKRRQEQAIANPAIFKVSKDYFIMNAQAEVFFNNKKYSVFIEADNLFNRVYADLLGAQMPGRWLMGGIKLSLSK